MSRTEAKTNRRRLALLSGGSMGAAALLASFAAASAILAPTAAMAANECAPVGVDPSVNPGADSYICSGSYAGTGVTYGSDGDLTIDAIGEVDVGAIGMNLTGNGIDNVTLSATGAITGISGPVIDVTSDSGTIQLNTAGVDGTTSGVTHGILATSTGGGTIDITTTGSVRATSETGVNAIEAITTGGDGDVIVTTGGVTFGGLRGIVAGSTGAGSTTINVGATVDIDLNAGVAAVEASAGTGGLVINANGNLVGRSGYAILANSAGDATINVAAGRNLLAAGTSPAIVSIATGADYTATINNAGLIDAGNAVSTAAAIIATGGSAVFNNSGVMEGFIDFSGLVGNSVFTNSGTWERRIGLSTFTGGDDLLDNLSTGRIITNRIGAESGIAFGGGDDTLSNAGLLLIGETTEDDDAGSNAEEFPSNFILTGLETFNNSGLILLGSLDGVVSDGWADDMLTAQGAAFTGSGSSRIAFDVDLGPTARTSCAPLAVADCVDLTGGSTAGVTLVTVNDIRPVVVNAPTVSFSGFNDGIVLVDVSGGTGQQGDFVLDPASDGYVVDPNAGPVLRKGLFYYALIYNADTQQHMLIGAPNGELMEFGVAPAQAQSIWRTTTGTVFERRADARMAGAEGGVWMRVAGDFGKRDLVQTHTAHGHTFSFDHGYDQNTGAVEAGLDFLRGEAMGGDYTAGVMLGYATSSITFDASSTEATMSGATVGLYAGWESDMLFVDGVVNSNFLTLKQDVLAIGDSVTTNLVSVGGQVEGGLTFAVTEGLFVQPLVSAAYVTTKIEAIDLAGQNAGPVKLQYEDAASLQAGLGLRLGYEAAYSGLTARYSLTGRAWSESEGQHAMVIRNAGADVPRLDDLSGEAREFQAGISLSSQDGALSGFVNAGARLMDDYQTITASAGVRYRW